MYWALTSEMRVSGVALLPDCTKSLLHKNVRHELAILGSHQMDFWYYCSSSVGLMMNFYPQALTHPASGAHLGVITVFTLELKQKQSPTLCDPKIGKYSPTLSFAPNIQLQHNRTISRVDQMPLRRNFRLQLASRSLGEVLLDRGLRIIILMRTNWLYVKVPTHPGGLSPRDLNLGDTVIDLDLCRVPGSRAVTSWNKVMFWTPCNLLLGIHACKGTEGRCAICPDLIHAWRRRHAIGRLCANFFNQSSF